LFASWCLGVRCEHTPRFAGTPFLLPHGIEGLVRSTLPSFAGTPTRPPTSQPRPFDHWIHSLTPRLLRGFSDLAPSLFGSAIEAIATSRSRRLESGSARIPVYILAIIVPNLANPKPRNFCGLFRIAPCAQVGHFGQLWTMSKMSKPRSYKTTTSRCEKPCS
jgi:hypothetical protein